MVKYLQYIFIKFTERNLIMARKEQINVIIKNYNFMKRPSKDCAERDGNARKGWIEWLLSCLKKFFWSTPKDK